MKTGPRMMRHWVAGLLMGAALVAAAGTAIPAAEAGPRPEVRDRTKTKKTAPRQKREVKPRREKKEPARARNDRREDARAPRDRRDDGDRAPRVRRDDGRRSDDRRPEAAPRRESRRPQVAPRHDSRRGSGPPRHERGGGDGWHRRVERRHDHVYYVPQRWFPRYARFPAHYFAPRHHRPWWARAARIYIHDDPFYFHVGLGLYIGGLAVQFDLGNVPPRGYVYYDPYCDEVFWTLTEYGYHRRWYDHPPVLTLMDADFCGY